MSDIEALPVAEEVPAEVGEKQVLEPAKDSPEVEEAKDEAKEEAKPEKTPEQREIDRMRRKIDRLVRQREELRAQNNGRLQETPIGDTNRQPQDDSDTLSLSRAELQQMVKDEAARLAPVVREQQAEIEHRQSVVKSLASTWGQEKFDALASDLDDVFGGLADRSGKPKPATDAIFEADDPAALIEYLADPDHADEAEVIARMGDRQAGRAIAKLEAKLSAAKSEAKPKASKAPAPLEATRGTGTTSGAPDPRDTKAWVKWANEQERKGLL
jgi:hypothetical protein